MLTDNREFRPLESHLKSHRAPRTLIFMIACAVVLTWWGGEAVLFPNISGNQPVRASGAAFVPLLLGIGVLISAVDTMGDFSATAALPRRRVLALHLLAALAVALLVSIGAPLFSGAAEAAPLAVRNLLG
ncbi:hypothetical protein NGM37_39290, partial [Streptomyces sp. TRM76130]|nr:hypothetical protein [Streptomyces sp. TRM76130]